MAHEFALKDPGEGIHEVDILEILVSEGDTVSEGQEVLVVESDKAAVELPSPYAGTVQEIRVRRDETATVGDILMIIADAGERSEQSGAEQDEAEDTGDTNGPGDANHGAETASKTARTEPSASDGNTNEEPDETTAQNGSEEETPPLGDAPVRASPAARRRAAEAGLDLSGIEPTGADGQVTVKDVEYAASRAETSREPGEDADDATPEAEAGAGAPDDDLDNFGTVTRVRASALRRATARAMQRSWSEIPHVWHEDVADITRLERWRARQADTGRDIPLTPILIKAAVMVLRDHSTFNATLDADSGDILLRRVFNVNVAVATERGLVTPVLQDADGKSVMELAEELATMAERAEAAKLSRDDIEGGTFTITNIGALGGRGLSPLINPPQTAILGAARTYRDVVAHVSDTGPVSAGDLELRAFLPLVLGFDHRVIDGADAAQFMNDLVAFLSDPVTLALET